MTKKAWNDAMGDCEAGIRWRKKKSERPKESRIALKLEKSIKPVTSKVWNAVSWFIDRNKRVFTQVKPLEKKK